MCLTEQNVYYLFDFFIQGFQRVFDDMADICLDVPLAYIMLDRFMDRCYKEGFLTDTIMKNMPTRYVHPVKLGYLYYLHGFEKCKRNLTLLYMFVFLIVAFCICRGRKRFVSEGDGGHIKDHRLLRH